MSSKGTRRRGHDKLSPGEVIDRSVREQNRFLNYCLKNNIEITLYLESGTQFIGYIESFDLKAILLGSKNPSKPNRLIQKSYIALVRPNAPVELFIEYRGMGTARQRKRDKRRLSD
tara:strand:+ start:274 stop:621 length:348 start_codon:yes stop_codon:yes gene_type:complete